VKTLHIYIKFSAYRVCMGVCRCGVGEERGCACATTMGSRKEES
jgi:hypothetical protein